MPSDETLLRWREEDPLSFPKCEDYDEWERIRDAKTEVVLRLLDAQRQTELSL